MSVVTYRAEGNIGIIEICNPPVNALSQAVRSGLQEAVQRAEVDTVDVVLFTCAGKTFVAGADISEFDKPPMMPILPDVLAQIEGCSKITLACLHGTALGGGLELALACDYRIAVSTAKLGLPEVTLGLIPGAGGTQRLPRLIAADEAIKMAALGEFRSAAQAKEIGLIDQIAEGDLFSSAIEFAGGLLAQGKRQRHEDVAPLSDEQIADWKRLLEKKFRGQRSPLVALDCIVAATHSTLQDGLAYERAAFQECKASPESAALRHKFFAEKQSPKLANVSDDVQPLAIQHVGVIGGGTMGAGISVCLLQAGYPVTMVERNTEALETGLDRVNQTLTRQFESQRLSETAYQDAMSRLKGTLSYDDLADTDLVIEAVFESLDVKEDVFRKLDAACKPGTILATNTSYLDINIIAGYTQRPEQVIGLHFFSPAHIMKLLEVIQGDQTTEVVLKTVMELAKKIRKIPVLSGVCYGFIGNRMLRQYFRETQLCLLEGASPQQIDQAMKNFGMAMGPLAVSDLAGLDISYNARRNLSPELRGKPETYAIADALVEADRIGQKCSLGYYDYRDDKRPKPDADVQAIIEKMSAKFGVTRRVLSDEEIVSRLTLTLINEGFKILEEGIAQRASDIDVVYVNGYGFPAFRGGPMFLAEQMGFETVLNKINEYRRTLDPDNWQPSALLESRASAS